MDLELLKEGSLIMIIGMGTVFFFLVIMIFAMEISSKVLKFINKFMPEEVEEVKSKNTKKQAQDNDAEIALAIACALERSRQC